MKTLLLIVGLALPSLSWALTMPAAGNYCGTGHLTRLSDGTQQNYTVTTSINGTTGAFTTTYTYANGFTYTLDFTITSGANGTFSVASGRTAAGNGFCIGQTCNFDIDYNDANLGALKTSISTTFSENGSISTGHNFTSNTIFQNTMQFCAR